MLQARKAHSFIKNYEGDWPVKEYLKTRFSNQRGYKRRCEADAEAKSKAMGEMLENMWDFGSDNNAQEEPSMFAIANENKTYLLLKLH